MKQRLLNIGKWFLISLGVLFLIQLLLLSGIIIGFNSMDKTIEPKFSNNQPKEIEPIIRYAQDYKDKYGKYPNTLEGLKLKKGLDFEYKTSDDFNCFDVVVKSKKSTKQYKRCDIKEENINSRSESYNEFNN